MPGWLFRSTATILAAILLNLLSLSAVASDQEASVTLEMPSGDWAGAAYWEGQPNMPAILIQHGFLQTHHFPTVRRLALALADSGFSVLTPTLTLGIDRRAASLPCEAVHTHNMQQVVDEMATWVDWLRAETGMQPVLIGHSAGGVNLLAYLTTKPTRDKVARAVFISVTFFGQGEVSFESPKHAARARASRARGNPGLEEYALGFCRQYVTTPAAYLSYYEWDEQRADEAFQSLGVPATLIAGSADGRIDLEWIETLQRYGTEIRIVEGGNHFFDQMHEFDLLDEIERILQAHRAR